MGTCLSFGVCIKETWLRNKDTSVCGHLALCLKVTVLQEGLTIIWIPLDLFPDT